MAYKVADTRRFLKLALKSREVSREQYRELKKTIDPDGVHVVWTSLLHNDVEVRAFWYVKLAGSDVPGKAGFVVPLADFNKLPVHEPVEAGDE